MDKSKIILAQIVLGLISFFSIEVLFYLLLKNKVIALLILLAINSFLLMMFLEIYSNRETS